MNPLSNKRSETETTEEYKQRRLKNKQVLKDYKKGQVLYDSSNKSTFRNPTK